LLPLLLLLLLMVIVTVLPAPVLPTLIFVKSLGLPARMAWSHHHNAFSSALPPNRYSNGFCHW
jgi:hypothetical protein